MGEEYIRDLKNKGIPAYCPRARRFFDQEEISLILGCFARILHYPEGKHNQMIRENFFPNYIDDCLIQLAEQCQLYPTLERELKAIEKKIYVAEETQESVSEQQLADYLYQLIFLDPFFSFLTHESKRSNLVIFSKLLRTFQKHYHCGSITQDNLEEIRTDFFQQFLYFLFEDGINLDENQQQPFPKGQVQIITIYQAKGLEFPVVVVGRLDKLPPSSDDEHMNLQRFHHHPSFEPANLIPGCDRRRLYYVDFSRAKDLLVLTARKKHHQYFAP